MKSAIKSAIFRLMDQPAIGAMDFRRNPERGIAWGGPFNGQDGRRAIFQALIESLKPKMIIETGTYLATTTEYLADTGLPVITVEGSGRNFGFSQARLEKRSLVTLRRGDSRSQLRKIIDEKILPSGTLFFYLDAHWNADLPLAEELDIIFSACASSIVMIDDFQVPDDASYTYDDYGPGKALIPDYIQPALDRYGLTALYPSLPGKDETGAKRGCVVLVSNDLAAAAADIAELRQVPVQR